MPATTIIVLSLIEICLEIFAYARLITVSEDFLESFIVCTDLLCRVLEGLICFKLNKILQTVCFDHLVCASLEICWCCCSFIYKDK